MRTNWCQMNLRVYLRIWHSVDGETAAAAGNIESELHDFSRDVIFEARDLKLMSFILHRIGNGFSTRRLLSVLRRAGPFDETFVMNSRNTFLVKQEGLSALILKRLPKKLEIVQVR